MRAKEDGNASRAPLPERRATGATLFVGIVATVFVFHVLCQTWLTCHASLCEPTKAILQEFYGTTCRVVGLPWQSVLVLVWRQIKSMRFENDINDLAIMSLVGRDSVAKFRLLISMPN